jgi:MIP family channel proteins
MQDRTRAYIAESLGTFAVVFIGAGSICLNEYTGHSLGLLGMALAQGLILAVAISATAATSGGHLNPAITLGFFILGKMDRNLALRYAGAQLLGAAVAGFSLRWVFAEHVWNPARLGTPDLAGDVTTMPGIFLEAILTFLLVFAYWGTLVDSRAPRIGGFGAGLTLSTAILVGGPLTGAALNPARAFGPALASGHWSSHLVYWLGPLLGGAAGAFIYGNFLLKDENGSAIGTHH